MNDGTSPERMRITVELPGRKVPSLTGMLKGFIAENTDASMLVTDPIIPTEPVRYIIGSDSPYDLTMVEWLFDGRISQVVPVVTKQTCTTFEQA